VSHELDPQGRSDRHDSLARLRLRRLLALDVVPAAGDADHAEIEVDVVPPERHHFAATQPA
jgi:hypothetical protein